MTSVPVNVTVTPQVNALLLQWGVNETAGLISFKILWRAVGASGWQWTILDAYQRQHEIGDLDPAVEYEAKVETAVYAGASPAVKAKPLPESPPPPPPVPVNTTPPIISGNAEVGAVLTASPGRWTNSPTAYAYQWFFNGAVIVGATNQTYAIPHAIGEVGHTISVQVVASNEGGASQPVLSAPTAPITEPPPPPTEGAWRGFGPVVPASFDPWAIDSFINQPVPSNPVVLSNSAGMCTFVQPSDVWTDGGYDHPVFFAKSSDPLVTVEGVQYGTWANGEQIRCPSNAHPAPGSDHHMTVVQPDGAVHGFWAVQNNGPLNGKLVAHGAGYSRSLAESSGVNERSAGATASGIEPACGTIRVEELAAGIIPHGLFIPCRVTKSGHHKPPATGGDGTSGEANAPEQGQRFYLAYSDAEITAAPWPKWKKTMITAMAHYGLWCGDSGGGFVKFWGQQSYTAYGPAFPQPFNELLKNEPGVSTNVGLGGPCLVLHLHEAVDWTRLRAIAWS